MTPSYVISKVNNITDEYRNNIIMGKSNHSYAVNNKITSLFSASSWAGKRCFIIGGGPSLKGFDFNRLNGELTIGINKAFKQYQNSTINYCMDSTLYSEIYEGKLDRSGEPKLVEYWNSYKGTRVFLTPMEIKVFGKEVYLVRKLLDPTVNKVDLEGGIYGGTNSGTGAITLAAALGANPIYLLGYDMQAIGQTHWHDGYEVGRDVEVFNKKLAEYRDDMAAIRPLLLEAGVAVVNLNPDSALKCFGFGTLEKVL